MRLGDIPVDIEGRPCFLRPDISALMAIEQALQIRLLRLAANLTSLDIGLADIEEILYQGLKSGSGEIGRAVLQKEIQANGLSAFLEPVSQFLEVAIRGPKKPITPPPEAIATPSPGTSSLDSPSAS